MTGVPQLDVPDILVDDEEQRAKRTDSLAAPRSQNPYSQRASSTTLGAPLVASPTAATFLSPHEARNSGTVSNHQKAWSGGSADLTLQTVFDGTGTHPLSRPRSGESLPSAGGASDAHQSLHSAFSFELQPSGSAASSAANSRRNSRSNSRSNSAVSPSQMSQILDDSIWMATIRRSATSSLKKKKSGW